MTDTPTRNAAIHDLLDRGRVAHNGARYARHKGDMRAATELNAKARALLQDAQAVDPTHEAPGWGIFNEFLAAMEKN